MGAKVQFPEAVMGGAVEALGSHVLDVRIFPEYRWQPILLSLLLFSKARGKKSLAA